MASKKFTIKLNTEGIEAIAKALEHIVGRLDEIEAKVDKIAGPVEHHAVHMLGDSAIVETNCEPPGRKG